MRILLLLLPCLLLGQLNPQQRPNIIYFLADDLGYGEIGVYGQEKIQTPNMDALAAEGMLFTQHYSAAPVCAPARCMFLTGKHAGNAYVRSNDEWRERGEVWDFAAVSKDPKLEGQRPMPQSTVTVAKLLQKAGYDTSIFGKWGLGGPTTHSVPTRMGFDYFYGYNCQRQAHNLYPLHLWENEDKVALNNALVQPHTGLDKGADPNLSASYARFTQPDYAPTLIHDKAVSYLKRKRDKPFFMYYASPLPHVPLQAPESWVAGYQDKIPETGPYLGKSYFPNQTPRATYAAMISYLDWQLGDLIRVLKETGAYENTIIFVTSDNGPTYTGGVDYEYFESSKPFTNGRGRTKGSVYEGGLRVPLIVSWPGKVENGSTSDHVSVFYDMMPTFCELAQTQVPQDTDGVSLLPTLLGEKQAQHDFLYWEFTGYKGQQAVRMGKWKAVRQKIQEGVLRTELYDLEEDILEQHDVSQNHPEIVAQIERFMQQEHTQAPNPKFRMKALGDSME
ncbi:arylsulfatase [Sediminicola luteus]|uniref:N-acetylgalactosamine-6-sulfatase n=1 Tax=Sediminicola luteus TaxID=319238 RepID=A0A2A4GFL1_9FLAO|nr:arylsulfatase [Sediminicola luteus]PCE66768.1 N-acetylgalactosamine-6-sulfatase [Sediminicola luteus]